MLDTEARAYFVFGDSIVDIRNINYVLTHARANSILFLMDLIKQTHQPRSKFVMEQVLRHLKKHAAGKEHSMALEIVQCYRTNAHTEIYTHILGP